MIKQLQTSFNIKSYLTEASGSVQLTGLTVYLKIYKESNNYYYDFNDNTFKNIGHITIETSMTEIGNGVYNYLFANAETSEDIYIAEIRYTYLTIEYKQKINYEVIDIASKANQGLIKAETDKIQTIDDNINAIKNTVDTNLNNTISSVLTAISNLNNIAISDIWDYLIANISTTDSIGKLLKDNINDTISSRLASIDYTAPNNANIQDTNNIVTSIKNTTEDTNTTIKIYDNYKADVSLLALESSLQVLNSTVNGLNNIAVNEVWDYLTNNITIAGSIGKLILDKFEEVLTNISGLENVTTTEIWDQLLTGIYTDGSIGKLLKDNIDSKISNNKTLLDLIKPETDKIETTKDYAQATNALLNLKLDEKISSRLSTANATTNKEAIITEINDNENKIDNLQATVDIIKPKDFWDFLLINIVVEGSIGKLIKDYLDTSISSRFDGSGYVAPDNTNIQNTNTKVTHIKTVIDDIDLDIDNIKNNTNFIPTIDNNVDNIKNTISTNLDVPVSSRNSTNNANGNTGNITSEIETNRANIGLNGTKIDELNNVSAIDIWNVLISNITVFGSVGKLLKDKLDNAISEAISAVSSLNNISENDVWNFLTTNISTAGSIGLYLQNNIDSIKNTTENTNTTIKIYDNYKANINNMALEATSQSIKSNVETNNDDIFNLQTSINSMDTKIDTFNISGLQAKVDEIQNVLYKYKRVLDTANSKAYYYDSNNNLAFTITFTTSATEQTYEFNT